MLIKFLLSKCFSSEGQTFQHRGVMLTKSLSEKNTKWCHLHKIQYLSVNRPCVCGLCYNCPEVSIINKQKRTVCYVKWLTCQVTYGKKWSSINKQQYRTMLVCSNNNTCYDPSVQECFCLLLHWYENGGGSKFFCTYVESSDQRCWPGSSNCMNINVDKL